MQLRIAFALLIIALMAPTCARGQSFSPYADFQAMSLAEMDSLRIKLTYGGPQDHIQMSLILAKAGTPASMSAFTPFRRSGFGYTNDDGPFGMEAVTATELKAVIDSVGTLPDITDGDMDPNGYVSFALLSTAGETTKVFEAIVNDTTGAALFGRTLGALKSDVDATRKVRVFGCDAAMLPKNLPDNVESQVTVTFSGLRIDRSSKTQFVGRVRVRNDSEVTIPSPLTLVVIRRGGNAKLVGEDGLTCNIRPSGVPFVILDVGSGLAPEATVQQTLRFNNPSLDKFDVHFRVFAGVGTQ